MAGVGDDILDGESLDCVAGGCVSFGDDSDNGTYGNKDTDSAQMLPGDGSSGGEMTDEDNEEGCIVDGCEGSLRLSEGDKTVGEDPETGIADGE